jgi:hypothetical protein
MVRPFGVTLQGTGEYVKSFFDFVAWFAAIGKE